MFIVLCAHFLFHWLLVTRPLIRGVLGQQIKIMGFSLMFCLVIVTFEVHF